MGTSLSTPGEPSSPSRWTCSRSPTAPITVSSSPREGCALAPTDSIRSITAWISASEAVGFITIIILRFLSYALEEYGRGRLPALDRELRGGQTPRGVSDRAPA